MFEMFWLLLTIALFAVAMLFMIAAFIAEEFEGSLRAAYWCVGFLAATAVAGSAGEMMFS